ncbi:MAG: recombination protein RecR [Flavobacteriales bacterium]|nr:recombination protein RecR [Flavobacteriales bacterium]
MNPQSHSSGVFEEAVLAFSKLPGIGKKTAVRMVLHMLRQDSAELERFGHAVLNLKDKIRYCKSCHNIADEELCHICNNTSRDHEMICVVENIRDVMAIENTRLYKGIYHILGGIISPMDGIGPSELNIESLVEKARNNAITEVIMALSTTMEGDTTNFYLYKRLKEFNVKVSTLARGVAMGDDLEYADELTLGRSLTHRIPYEELTSR